MATFEQGLSEAVTVLRRRGAMTRSEFVEETGLSRSAVNLRLDALGAAGLIRGSQGQVQTKGRPADKFHFNESRGKLLAADMGVTKYRAGLCDLSGTVEIEDSAEISVEEGPEVVLEKLHEVFQGFLEKTGTDVREILGIGVSVPGPVKMDSGISVNPPIMPNWNRFEVPAWFARHYDCPVFLEKDANAMAFGESRMSYPDVDNLMMVKIGTGIGSGMILGGQLFRGADGAAGDLGHTQVELLSDDGPLCKCGNYGCLEAYAGGWAILRDLQEAGAKVSSQEELVQMLRAGDPEAIRAVRRAGRVAGSAIASAVNIVNPRVLVLGGRMVSAGGDHLFAGIREMVYRRSLPLATSELRIERSTLYPRAGLVGLAHLIGDSIFSPEQIGRLVSPAEG